jgi:prepilin-type N-terminal cleavage/methylation domain-containing protein
MQKSPRRSCAFTLIELLVVIAIIAILIGLLFPAFRAVQNQAKNVQTKNDLTQIVNAVNAYYTDYGKYPLDTPTGNTSDAYFGSGTPPTGAASFGTNDWLLDVLRSNTSSTKTATYACPAGTNLVTCLNPRQIVFISPPSVKDTANPRAGIGSNGRYYDPWGVTYNVEIDALYNNSVPNPYGGPGTGGAGSNPVPQGIIGWSFGSDQTLGTNGNGVYKDPTTGAQSDDLISWQ